MFKGEYESVINRSFLPVSPSLISSFLFVIQFSAIELCDVATKELFGRIKKAIFDFGCDAKRLSSSLEAAEVRLFTRTFTR
jgi:hypothetical protein